MRSLLLPCVFFLLAAPVLAETIEAPDDAALAAALRRAAPGDTVRLTAAEYRGGIQARLVGKKDAPLTIESADPKKPALFHGQLHLSGAEYVTIRDIEVRGSTTNGLNIDDGGDMDQSAVGITLERVRVFDTGPKGNNDGIKLSGLRDFTIRECHVEGWGGSAIDMVGCAKGVIEKSTFKGKPGFDQSNAIQMKGGSRDVTVRYCKFDNAGQRAINAGGSTGLQFFRPLDATFEAKDLVIENNLIQGSDAPVAFVGIDGGVFRNNTIIEPTKWVLRILQENTDARFNKSRNVSFERNLIVYKRAVVKVIANVGPNTSPETFKFSENWWWCPDGARTKPELPANERLGVYGRDPKLKDDASGLPLPTDPAASEFGVQPAQ